MRFTYLLKIYYELIVIITIVQHFPNPDRYTAMD